MAAFELVVVGASLGGLRVLKTILSGLPKSFSVPVAIVQHRQPGADDTLSELLARECAIPLGEATDKEPIEAGRVYLAPADYHLLVDDARFALSTEAPVLCARPSIDVLFESAADAFGRGVIALALTGASHDGARGLKCVVERGGRAIVQVPATAESSILPEAAIQATTVDRVLPPSEIADCVVQFCKEAP